MLSAKDAAALCSQLEEHRIRFWVMGGWGVDALLQRQTRPHKDLDILVLLGDLSKLRQMLTEHGFILKRVWQESRPLGEEAGRWPSAFVAADAQGREIDVHVIDIGPDGRIVQHYDDPWPLPASIAGQGSIAGTDVTCISRETQVAMHTGYALPDEHLQDLDLLQRD
jgi:lincosamide nucleotidyltransferase A/C/D/E